MVELIAQIAKTLLHLCDRAHLFSREIAYLHEKTLKADLKADRNDREARKGIEQLQKDVKLIVKWGVEYGGLGHFVASQVIKKETNKARATAAVRDALRSGDIGLRESFKFVLDAIEERDGG